MKIEPKDAHVKHIVNTASAMMAAARTAPKAHGYDRLECVALTGEEKNALTAEMRRIAAATCQDFIARDAENVDRSTAIVLFGTRNEPYDLDCGFCGRESCRAAMEDGTMCFFAAHDLGLAIGSAVSVAADMRVDNRVMYSAGLAAKELGVFGVPVQAAIGVPLSVSEKSVYFDRK
ncbi:MAG: ferredoxin [Firmicutes bacterium]|nr:ferredoxin [Bacillota bacterium]